jgi:hypothetical protein
MCIAATPARLTFLYPVLAHFLVEKPSVNPEEFGGFALVPLGLSQSALGE